MGVLTAPLAVIKVNGEAVGLMRDIRITETVRRIPIRGLGALTPSELPAVEWEGRLTCSFYNISFKETGVPGAVKRDLNRVQQWVDNVLLQEEGVDLVVYKKEKDTVDQTTGNITPKLTEICTVRGAFFTSDGMDISDGQVSGRNQEFMYLNPVLEQI